MTSTDPRDSAGHDDVAAQHALLLSRARQWAAGDPDPATREALEALVDAEDTDALVSLVGDHLAFGTAGLRGEVGPGPNRMNRAVVIRATRGLADHLLAEVPDAATRGVVVGFDARPDSERFARDVVAVLRAAGIAVAWYPTPTPTPLVAWAARDRDAAGAVVVTASHNPPADNGYKVYDQYGVQITPPTDAAIAAAITAVGPARDVPGVGDELDAPGPELDELGDAAVRRYLAAIAAARPDVAGDRDVPLVLTPMHGVGGAVLDRALQDAGFTAVHQVAEQWEPDGAFPTVAFPNPEEPGALDLAMSLADEVGAVAVLATDPDADRLAVALPGEDGWHRLSGDQVGCLLADHLLRHTVAPDPLVVSSVVSSARLDAVAAHHGARRETTLTGFKWIWRAGRELADVTTFVLGYEEALGYSVGEVVRDKDGIAAAVVMAELVAALAGRGRTLDDAMGDLEVVSGRWANVQRSVRREGHRGAGEIAAAVESAAVAPPRELGPRTVARVEDLTQGADDRPPWLPADTVVVWHLQGGGRVLVRPSGTEPKLKVYADVRLHDEEPATVAEEVADAAVAALGLRTGT
jgi:phosphomannomutase